MCVYPADPHVHWVYPAQYPDAITKEPVQAPGSHEPKGAVYPSGVSPAHAHAHAHENLLAPQVSRQQSGPHFVSSDAVASPAAVA